MTCPPVVLSVAGTDSGGAAGLAADLTTFAALGAHGACAVTAVTAQDTTGVHAIVPLSAADVGAQIKAVLGDLPVSAAKSGMLGSAGVALVVADLVAGSVPLVVDPVLTATSGAILGDDALVTAYRDVLLPQCAVVTPNLDEAVRLTGLDPGRPRTEIARALHQMAPAVVLTGGSPDAQMCRDVVIDRAGHLSVLDHPAVPSRNDHGTGCTFSAALAVHLANGLDLRSGVLLAQAFVTTRLTLAAPWQLGRGRGPIAHIFTHPHQEN